MTTGGADDGNKEQADSNKNRMRVDARPDLMVVILLKRGDSFLFLNISISCLAVETCGVSKKKRRSLRPRPLLIHLNSIRLGIRPQ